MHFTWQQIHRDWLRGESVPYSRRSVVEGFNKIGKYFPKIIKDCHLQNEIVNIIFGGPTSLKSKVLYIVESGLILSRLETLPKFTKLKNKIKEDFIEGMAEALMAAYLVTKSLKVKLYPNLNGKQPDLRVTWVGDWIYMEVTCIKQREVVARRLEMLRKRILNEQVHGRTQINFLKEPDNDEVNRVVQRATALLERWKDTSDINTEKIENLCIISFDPNVKGNFFGMSFPHSDERLERFVNKEAKQLSEKVKGIIVIDITGHIKEAREWAISLDRKLDSYKDKRFGAVIVLKRKWPDRYPVDVEIINNKYGLTIPPSFLNLMKLM